MQTELVMYSRSTGCGFVNIAKRLLNSQDISYREILIDEDDEAKQRVVAWTGFQSVPTLIIAPKGELMPIEEPAYLEPGATPRGVDRGVMITEPNREQLAAWLQKHGLLQVASTTDA